MVLILPELELDGSEVGSDNFPLQALAKKLETIRDDVYDGKGFAVLRGLDPDAYSSGDLMVIYLGISSYIASVTGKQDQRGSHISESIIAISILRMFTSMNGLTKMSSVHVIDRNYPQAVKNSADEKVEDPSLFGYYSVEE